IRFEDEDMPFGLKTMKSYEKTYLKAELVNLVDYLQALDPRFRFDPDCFPSNLSTSRECLLTDEQMQDLSVLYENYNVYRSENQRKASEAFRSYLKMKEDYERKLLHNNAMIDEIKAVRIKTFQWRYVNQTIQLPNMQRNALTK
ncbi:uncharacterized protein NPIL_221071, partial [Nephila pilipes]